MRVRSRSGFTLIELLIVVAIIGILAAIAIPNFLNAQTRARVSRVKADMKALETALHMYRVDHNTFLPGMGMNPPDQYRPLTTPVAYIARPPVDPFRYADRDTRRIWNNDVRTFPTAEIDYGGFRASGASSLNDWSEPVTDWYLISLGPDYDEDVNIFLAFPGTGTLYRKDLYNASNGLHSSGDLLHNTWNTMHF